MVEPAPAWMRASRVAVSGSIRSMKKRAVTSFAFRRAAVPVALGNLASAALGDPEQQSRSWLRSSAYHREPMPVPSNLCRDLHIFRLGGAANAIREVGHKATANFCRPQKRLRNSDVTT